MERTGERTYERALPRRFLRAGRGQGAQTPPPRPAPPPPLSSSATKSLTDADHFGMIRTAQRRFAPTVIGITRNSDRHQIGMSDRHRRNRQRRRLLMTSSQGCRRFRPSGRRYFRWGSELRLSKLRLSKQNHFETIVVEPFSHTVD